VRLLNLKVKPEAGVPFPKTHDVAALLRLLLTLEPLWSAFLPHAQLLEDYAVDFRYTLDTATLDEARQAFKNCKSIRREVRSSLGLPV
jgi:hypothetical protein